MDFFLPPSVSSLMQYKLWNQRLSEVVFLSLQSFLENVYTFSCLVSNMTHMSMKSRQTWYYACRDAKSKIVLRNFGEILMRLHKLFGTATMCIASLQTLLAAPQEFHALLHSGQFLHFFCFFLANIVRKLHTTWLMWEINPIFLRSR